MHVRATAMALGTAMGLALVAISAGAQDYDSSAPEEVIVTPPPHAPTRSIIGAPIIEVSMSQPVHFGDLDLRTSDGVHELRNRVSFAATTLCRRLSAMYPVSYDGTGDEWPRDSNCYRDAVARAMVQADAAVRAARGL